MKVSTVKPFPADGSPLTCDAGSYTIQLTPTIDGGYTLRVMAGPNEITDMAQQFTDETMARAVARQLAAGLRAGISIHQFIGDRKAAEQGLVAEINESMNTATDRYLAPRRNARQVAAETVTGDGAAWRARVRRNTAETVWDRTTKSALTGSDAELSDPQLRALALADINGEIRVQRGIAATTLQSMARKNLGRLALGGRTPYTVRKLVLNDAGRTAAGMEMTA